MIEGYKISNNRKDFNVDAIHKFLSDSYWAKGVPIDVVSRAIENSLCFGITCHGDQVGFARLITDRATFAYLADVYVLENHRGKGLSRWLMQEIISHPDLQGLRRMVLATRDAHEIYANFGFKKLANPETFMELWKPEAYKA